MNPICYLCGEEISGEKPSDDHVVPKQFIKRDQPKVKGFDYAGTLPSHEDCNNRYGSEIISQKALELLHILYNPDIERVHRDNPNIRIKCITTKHLSSFSEYDLNFFGLIDTRNIKYDEWSKPEFFKDKKPLNLDIPLNIILSVLSKSAAAILVSRFKILPSSNWKIIAVPYYSKNQEIDLDDLLGKIKPFEIGLKLWVKKFENGDYYCFYKHHGFIVLFVFSFLNESINLNIANNVFKNEGKYLFQGRKLNELINYDWAKTKFFD